ncbi:MAG: 30S ribosomal protein S8 [Candidatus Binataceae bacterium]
MPHTDPIADMLTRIRNGTRARFNEVTIPHSRLKEAICRVLAGEGFLDTVEVEGEIPKKLLRVKLRYSDDREPVIRDIQRVSRPSIRRYAGADAVAKARGAMGVHLVSTPLGVMTGRAARRKRVGGEVLLTVW